MNPVSLVVASLLASAPVRIEMALAERSGPDTARLVLLRADPRLEASCLDSWGPDAAAIAQARERVVGLPIALYLGTRRVARGVIEALESEGPPLGPCVVTAQARFDAPVPFAGGDDVLWASSTRFGSHPRRPAARGAITRAREALPDAVAGACRSAVTTARAAVGGSFVGFTCPAGTRTISVLVHVPQRGTPRPLRVEHGEEGVVRLREVLEGARGMVRVVLERELDGGSRVELWAFDGGGLRRLDGAAY